jgi:tRNA-Thr(GGU) m(6)t(6)A37 methyltransferase TsaA
MGTPRQGMLVPSSRGYIQFAATLSSEAVDGIGEYSHIWVIFAFHENTSLATSHKSKVRPPRAGGIKVGQLATRSPHRPNELGLSLVKLERWEPSSKRLFISALDLVDGTPVYDIKPYVHWDIPSVVDFDASKLRVPSWVENQDDILPRVEFTNDATAAIEDYFQFDYLAPLYPSNDPTALEAAMQTLREILAQDPRSSHKGVSKNQRGSVSSEGYHLMFCRLEIEFIVKESGATVVGMRKAPDRDALLSPTKAVTPLKVSRSTFSGSKLPLTAP